MKIAQDQMDFLSEQRTLNETLRQHRSLPIKRQKEARESERKMIKF